MSVPGDQTGFGDTSLGSGDSFNTSSAPDLGFTSAGGSYPTGSPAATQAATDLGPGSTVGGYSGIGTTSPATTSASSTGSSTAGILSGLGNVGSAIGGVLASPLGQLGLASGAYELIAGQAAQTQTQNNALAGQISAIGQPEVTAGQNLLSTYEAGGLTQPFSGQLASAQAADKNAAVSQQQQVAQLLANSGGGQNVQSALGSESQQIQTQQQLNDQTAMSNAFLGELNASLGLTNAGGAYVQQGILTEIQSNTALQQQLSQLMGALAQAYAQSTGGAAAGTSAAAVGNLFNSVSQLLNPNTANSVSKLLGQTGSSGANAAATAANIDAGTGTAASDAAIAGSESGADVSAGISGAVGDAASTDLSGILGGEGAGSAAAGAAGADVAGTAAGLTAADLGAAAPAIDLLGADTAVAASLGTDAAATGAVAAGAGAGASTALGTLAAVAPYAAAVVAIGYGIYDLAKGPHTQDNINTVAPGQNVIKLQSGNSALQQGNFAVGAGSSRAQGSGQAFIVPSTATTINGQQVAAGQPYALSTWSNTLLEDYADGKIDTSQPISANSGANQYSDLYDVYGNNGGQATWGVDFPTWLTQIKGVYGNVSGNLWDN